MAIATGLCRIVLGGKIGAVQTWSIGFWWSRPTGLHVQTNAELLANLNAIKTAVQTWGSTGFAGANSSDTTLNTLSAYSYSPTSGTTAVATASIALTAVAGGSTTYLPTFTSLVCSLRTAQSGRRYRGRVYVPLTGSALTAGHRVTAGNAQQLVNATATLLSAINATWQDPGEANPKGAVIVRSNIGGFTTPVTSVIVDDLPDTQHRREDKIGITVSATSAVTAAP